MTNKNIKNLTKRQFDKTMLKEGRYVNDYFTDEIYNVFFRTVKHSDSTASKLRIYYDKDCDIKKGTLFKFMGNTYLVINQDGIESEIYNTSICTKCTANLYFKIGEEVKEIPWIVSELGSVNPSKGAVLTVINGSLTVYTQDNGWFRSIKVDDAVVNWGGTFKVINTFYYFGYKI